MASTPHILKLPIELLQLIAEDCDPATDILSLRLTCKELAAAAAASSLFANHYISYLRWFMLEPGRFMRILSILATPHLSAKIKTVRLTLNAHEDAGDFLVAEHASHGIDKNAWYAIKNIIGLVAQRPECSLIVDLCSENSVVVRVVQKRPKLLEELLGLALSAGCAVSDISIPDEFQAELDHFSPSGKFHSMLEGLAMFQYQADLSYLEKFDGATAT